MQNSGKHWSGRGFKSNEREVFLWHQSAPDMPAQSLLSLLSQECHKQPLKELGSPGSSGTDPAGFPLCLHGEANKVPRNGPYWFCARFYSWIHSHRAFDTTRNITCSSHGWEGFSPNAGTTSNMENQQFVFSEPAPSSHTPPWAAGHTELSCSEAPSLCLLRKGNKTARTHQKPLV